MDPFTIALAVFGVSKLTGSSTKNALKNAFLAGTGSYAIGASTSAGALGGFGQGEAFSGITSLLSGAPAAVTTPVVEGGLTASNLINPALSSVNEAGLTASQIGENIPKLAEVYKAPTNIFQKGFEAFKNADTATQLGLGAAGVTLAGSLGADDEPMKRPPGMSDEDYARAMEEARLQVKDIGRKAPAQTASTTSPYNYGQDSLYKFNTGGIVSVMRKFSQGGINLSLIHI